MESSNMPRTTKRSTVSRKRQTAVDVPDRNGQRPGFDVTYESVIGRIEYEGDGNQGPGEAAMALVGREYDNGHDGNGTFRFPGPNEGQVVEVTVGLAEVQEHPGALAIQAVLARILGRGGSPRAAIKDLIAEGKIPSSVNQMWLTDRVNSLLADEA